MSFDKSRIALGLYSFIPIHVGVALTQVEEVSVPMVHDNVIN